MFTLPRRLETVQEKSVAGERTKVNMAFLLQNEILEYRHHYSTLVAASVQTGQCTLKLDVY